MNTPIRRSSKSRSSSGGTSSGVPAIGRRSGCGGWVIRGRKKTVLFHVTCRLRCGRSGARRLAARLQSFRRSPRDGQWRATITI